MTIFLFKFIDLFINDVEKEMYKLKRSVPFFILIHFDISEFVYLTRHKGLFRISKVNDIRLQRYRDYQIRIEHSTPYAEFS